MSLLPPALHAPTLLLPAGPADDHAGHEPVPAANGAAEEEGSGENAGGGEALEATVQRTLPFPRPEALLQPQVGCTCTSDTHGAPCSSCSPTPPAGEPNQLAAHMAHRAHGQQQMNTRAVFIFFTSPKRTGQCEKRSCGQVCSYESSHAHEPTGWASSP